MRGLGTVANVAAIVAGGFLGILLRSGLKERFQEILMQALGVATMFVGLSGALRGLLVIENGSLAVGGTMLMIFSLAIGSLIGEWINIEALLERFGEWLKRRFGGKNDSRFTEGFMAASLTVCVGAMAIVGSLEDGLTGNASTLYAKALIDGVLLIVFASTYGKGAVFSAVPLGLWQGAITLFAGIIAPFLTDAVISDLSYVGNVLIFCVGANLALHTRFRVANMLPSLLCVAVYEAACIVF